MRDIEIPTERTIIRPFAPEDAGEVFACISPEITQFTAWEPPPTEEAFAEVWENWLPAMDEGSELTLVPAVATMVGALAFSAYTPFNPGHPSLESGYAATCMEEGLVTS